MKKFSILIALLIPLVLGNALSQVAMHPGGVFIDPKTRAGSMTIQNNSEDERELEIIFKFGYIDYDSLGNQFVNYEDSVAAEKYSLKPYIKVFPKKLIIPPREFQEVRFMVRRLPDTERTYWARIVVSSSPVVKQIDTTGEEGITAAIIIRTNIIGLVVYQHGSVNSGLDISFDRCTIDSAKVNLLINHEKSGNSPFWGTMIIEIFDEEDEKVLEKTEMLAIYFDCIKRISFDRNKFKPGSKYTAKIFINNERKELPPERMMPFKNINRTFEFTVP